MKISIYASNLKFCKLKMLKLGFKDLKLWYLLPPFWALGNQTAFRAICSAPQSCDCTLYFYQKLVFISGFRPSLPPSEEWVCLMTVALNKCNVCLMTATKKVNSGMVTEWLTLWPPRLTTKIMSSLQSYVEDYLYLSAVLSCCLFLR